jgi:hypothetical protein
MEQKKAVEIQAGLAMGLYRGRQIFSRARKPLSENREVPLEVWSGSPLGPLPPASRIQNLVSFLGHGVQIRGDSGGGVRPQEENYCKITVIK